MIIRSAGVVIAGAVLTAASVAPAGTTAPTTLDRTFSCAVVTRGGTLELESRAHAGTKHAGRWYKLPYAALRTGVFSGPTGNLLLWVTAGRPDAETTLDQEFETFDARAFGTIGVRTDLCTTVERSVPLTSAGLRGGPAAALGDEFECIAPRRVLVRLRATLSAPAMLRGKGDFRALHVPVREAKLAVRTLTGKPLVYADVAQSGRARLFNARDCELQ